jgi:hypothetical protein
VKQVLKCIGIGAVLFFTLKGLAWLALAYFAADALL